MYIYTYIYIYIYISSLTHDSTATKSFLNLLRACWEKAMKRLKAMSIARELATGTWLVAGAGLGCHANN